MQSIYVWHFQKQSHVKEKKDPQTMNEHTYKDRICYKDPTRDDDQLGHRPGFGRSGSRELFPSGAFEASRSQWSI